MAGNEFEKMDFKYLWINELIFMHPAKYLNKKVVGQIINNI